MKSASLPRLTGIFLRVNNLTFGGGDPATAALYTELVSARGWLAAETYGLVFALARITPGTNVLAFCAGVAWKIAGWSAAVLAVLAAALPSSACVALLTVGYQSWKNNAHAMSAISGLLAASVGLMLTGAWQLLQPHVITADWRRTVRAAAFACAGLLLSYRFHMAPIQVLGLAALGGFLWRGHGE